MDCSSYQWLKAIGRKEYASRFARHGFVTLERCKQLSIWKLEKMEITNKSYSWDKWDLWNEAQRLNGRTEQEVIQELPVSVPHCHTNPTGVLICTQK